MKDDLSALSTVKRETKRLGFYVGPVNGLWTHETERAFETMVASVRVNARRWGDRRLTVAAGQTICLLEKIDPGPVDGYIGESTLHAYRVFAARRRGDLDEDTWRDTMPAPPTVQPVTKKSRSWPTQKGVLRFYGPVGQNQTMLAIPVSDAARVEHANQGRAHVVP